jgi:hypothetical protein
VVVVVVVVAVAVVLRVVAVSLVVVGKVAQAEREAGPAAPAELCSYS